MEIIVLLNMGAKNPWGEGWEKGMGKLGGMGVGERWKGINFQTKGKVHI